MTKFFIFLPVSGAASPESRQTMVALRVAEHSEFLLKRGRCKTWAKRSQLWFACFAAQRPVRQRSIAADLTFWLLFGQAKSNSPAAIERQEQCTTCA
jgi:hypothetical protein